MFTVSLISLECKLMVASHFHKSFGWTWMTTTSDFIQASSLCTLSYFDTFRVHTTDKWTNGSKVVFQMLCETYFAKLWQNEIDTTRSHIFLLLPVISFCYNSDVKISHSSKSNWPTHKLWVFCHIRTVPLAFDNLYWCCMHMKFFDHYQRLYIFVCMDLINWNYISSVLRMGQYMLVYQTGTSFCSWI
jgi:hypothetical protein